MRKITLVDRLRYRFDSTMSRGPIALVGWLFIASAILILLISIVVVVLRIGPTGESGRPLSFFETAWFSLMRTLDAGTMGGDAGSWPFLFAMLAVTLGGIFVVSTLIGVLTSSIENKLAELRKGRSFVVASLFIITLVGCSSAAEPTQPPTVAITVQPTRAATITPTNTSTPTLTATAKSTQTSKPTLTRTPEPTLTKEPTRTPTKPPTTAPPTATKPAPTSTRPPAPTATRRPPTVTPQPAANCDPSYPDVCIPPPPPDLDCKDIPYKRFRVLPPDPHRFDGDKNGIGCEN